MEALAHLLQGQLILQMSLNAGANGSNKRRVLRGGFGRVRLAILQHFLNQALNLGHVPEVTARTTASWFGT